MNLIPAILILLATASLFYASLPLFTSLEKKKKENLCRKMSRVGAANNFIFCSQEILQNKVMGFDGVHKKIMILEKIRNAYYYSIILLDEVSNCQLIIDPGSSATLKLQFEFNNYLQPVSIIFSDGIINSKREFDFLKAKAEYWCVMFSKILKKQIEVAA